MGAGGTLNSNNYRISLSTVGAIAVRALWTLNAGYSTEYTRWGLPDTGIRQCATAQESNQRIYCGGMERDGRRVLRVLLTATPAYN